MFGIDDSGIWIAYILAFGCLIFSVVFGITHWNKEDKSDHDDSNLV